MSYQCFCGSAIDVQLKIENTWQVYPFYYVYLSLILVSYVGFEWTYVFQLSERKKIHTFH